MRAVLRCIEKVIRLFTAALFVTAIVVNFANIVGRYVFLSPIYWAEEITILLVIWAVFLIGFELTLRGEHLKMGLLSALLPERYDRPLQTVIALVGGIIAIYVVYHSVAIVSMVIRYSQVTAVAQIPKWLLFGSVSTGFTLIAVASFIRAVDMLLSRNGNGKERELKC
jgi:TRAP-type C4-dicarboxylate transport system permease small subunit